MAKLDRIGLIKKYIEDTVISWEPDSEYTEGSYDTGKDIVRVIQRIENGEFDGIDTDSIEW